MESNKAGRCFSFYFFFNLFGMVTTYKDALERTNTTYND